MVDLKLLPTIPEYFQKEVDPTIDLLETHSIPCPFHGEVSGKSFTYSLELDTWRCWGQCKCGGSVIDLHRLHLRLATKEEAEKSLINKYNLRSKMIPKFSVPEPPEVQQSYIDSQFFYNKALRLAKTPEQWIELDYVLSQHPIDSEKLRQYCELNKPSY